jgi:hypothetical protein
MSDKTSLEIALGNHQGVPPDWMPASQVGPFIIEDPVLVWLEYHGAEHGFQPDTSPYEFGDFIAEKGRQFEETWLQKMAPGAVQVCHTAGEARSAGKVQETFELMGQGAPLIAQPALWWAPERIYGAPDLLVHSAWLRQKFPDLLDEAESRVAASYLGDSGQPGHYVVFDLKFTTKLDSSRKARDLEAYAAQLRLYSYMLGHLQGLMPKQAFLIARDRLDDPLPVDVQSALGGPLDADLAAMRDWFVEIKVNGAGYLPWEDDIVAYNLSNQDDRWGTAKETMARDKTPGGDSALVYQIGHKAKLELAGLGYLSLASMLDEDPETIPLEKCRGVGAKKAEQIRAVLQANRSGVPLLPPPDSVPAKRPFEFFVDFEYFTNVNVDFETQWPALEGKEMVFMIGVGREDAGSWRYKAFVAEAEDQAGELGIYEAFLDYVGAETGGATLDDSRVVFYHWTGAEVWQSRRVADRLQLPEDHPLRGLPWVDLQKPFLDGPGALPDAWSYGLKTVAGALGELHPEFATHWPGDLDEGLQAMVMGWQAYQSPEPAASEEMQVITQYLEADCQALWNILRWLRTGIE